MNPATKAELFRELPSVDEVLHAEGVVELVYRHGSASVTDAIRSVLSRLREEIASGLLDSAGLRLALSLVPGGVPLAIEQEIRRTLRHSLRPVINATGVILHTNLGRAPLAESALQHVSECAKSYSNLEFDVEAGTRGERDVHVDRLFRKLLAESGAEEASDPPRTIAVNNNAAAVLLALNTLAEGAEVIVSRGELVEIGGSFRIPDVMTKSGAILREVGTTNRTRIADFENAVNERTKLLLRVHRSNFEITGFTEQPSLQELVALGRRRSLPVMEDLGSGALVDLHNFGVHGEATVAESLRAGVDVVTYSGDKLLGGPQAGIVSGRRDLITRMRANSLFRALRVDKLTYASLEATLLAYVKREFDAIPSLKMMRLSREEITSRASGVAELLKNSQKLRVEIIDGNSLVGGGAAPSAVLPTRLLAVTCKDRSADELAASLRASDPPIVARVEEGRVLLDLRTVFPPQDSLIATALARIGS